MALAYNVVHFSAFVGHIALPVVMSTCGKIFNQDFKQVMTPYQYTLIFYMKGRKPAIHPDVVVEAVLQFKDRIVIEDNGEKIYPTI
ncbi:Uncharacterized protein FWK35_00029874 [Aphis craccivora]|uniref:Uncharacterized protein n=1 Tax=Aphis craccivora TaxID=307492 RepID=A0A6G0W1R7_APHCR|nr:Uncharacterized protein FWK35_00029874 [Aphis craccivora]